MTMLGRMSIRSRLNSAFFILTGITACCIVIALQRLEAINTSLSRVDASVLPTLTRISVLDERANLVARDLRNALLFTDEAKVGEVLGEADQQRREFEGTLAQLESAKDNSAEAKRSLVALRQGFDAYLPLHARLAEMVRDKDRRVAATEYLIGPVRDAQLRYMTSLEALKVTQFKYLHEVVEEGERIHSATRWLFYVLLLVAVVASLVLASLISLSITRPIERAVGIAEQVARGDLRRLEIETQSDETGRLLLALQTMTDELQDLVQAVRSSSEAIATQSEQLADGNAHLSERTERQAVNLQETAATMEQLTSMVQRNALAAGQAAQLAASASSVAEAGGSAMQRVVVEMGEISTGASRINDILGSIDALAFQTNLLALNASVEAARAGQLGRGFAVVAAEVRVLAKRSADAAGQIRRLVAHEAAVVESGESAVLQAGQTMDRIVAEVRHVHHLLREISTASALQSDSIQQVGEVVAQLDDATQQNASLVVQGSTTAVELLGQARSLSQAVSVFRTTPAGSRMKG
ncbi:methyl-accepting chemotaxis protein [Paucibacter sp. R3-3]|uniref:Methyl-accepting chemotaxis protein n=1 Tax=Roseateles agri TaxID=3098619 RepID=A0ABU5DU32_9BURK|nr:methyl-accepting chemotaxis protein [Paucibacter sp. R3-3]MDY0749084.1 methyl-accepting chemotaxis protein [Paucibacter sp. R3-3]